MYNAKLTESHLLPDEVNVKLDMFCPPLMNQVGGHVYGRDIVTEDNRGLGRGDA